MSEYFLHLLLIICYYMFNNPKTLNYMLQHSIFIPKWHYCVALAMLPYSLILRALLQSKYIVGLVLTATKNPFL